MKFYVKVTVLALSMCALGRLSEGQVSIGAQAFGSFNPSSFETVNEGDLNVHFEIPIVSKAGRGIPFSYSLAYDNSVWAPANSSGTAGWNPAGNWGWSAVTQVVTGYITYEYTPPIQCGGPPPNTSTYALASNFQYHDTLGAIHTFVGAVTYYSSHNFNCGPGAMTITNQIANDGSGYRLTASMAGTLATSVSASLVSRSGTAITAPLITGSGSGKVTDTNGNFVAAALSGTTTTFTDTLGLTALTASGSATPSSALSLSYTNPGGGQSAYTVNYGTYNVQTAFGCSGVGEYAHTGIFLVSSVVLPDSTRYTMAYEPTSGVSGSVTGRLASVQLPTGGTISFVYSTGSTNAITCTDGSASYLKRTSPDGTWTYSHGETGTLWTTAMTDPALNVTNLKFQSVNAGEAINSYEVERITNSGTSTMLQTVGTCYNQSPSPCTTTALAIPFSSVSAITTSPVDNIQSQVVSNYDGNGNNTSVLEYDNAKGAPGALIRETDTPIITTLTGIYDHPLARQLKNGSGTILFQTAYTYDETGAVPTMNTPSHGATLPGASRGNVTTMTQITSATTYLKWTYTNFDTGNVQTTTDDNLATTTQVYGATTSCGNSFPTSTNLPLSLTKSYTWSCNGALQLTQTDENGQVSTTQYSDANFWRPTGYIDPTGADTTYAYSSSTPQWMESTLNFNGGNSTQDVVANLDVLGRVSTVQQRQGPSATNYDTVATTYDGNGRPYEVTMPYSAALRAAVTLNAPTKLAYDTLNRVTSVTDGGGAMTTYAYQGNNDVLVTKGPAAPLENTKRRQLEYDEAGRISSVCEVSSVLTGAAACGQYTSQTGYLTKYSYNLLNNVTAVSQNAQAGSTNIQTRSFGYDYMGRMTSEAVPETNSVAKTLTYDTDTTCAASSGDLVKRTDPMGNVTCYAYDSLHRVTGITYPSGAYSAVTPQKHYVYDTATVSGAAMANAKNRLAEAYTGPSTGKVTDTGFSYTARGQVSDTYAASPHSGATYSHQTVTYWPNGLQNVFSSNIGGVPALTYAADGEGRVSLMSAATGQNPVTATTYNVNSQVTNVTLGSTDTQTFGFDANTGRPLSYSFFVDAKTETGTITNNTNGTIQKLAISDPFTASDTQTCAFIYDDAGRLSTDNCGTKWGAAYSYDAFGNISKSTIAGSPGTSFLATYNLASNRFATIPAATPSYDANGNLTGDGFHTYGWDAEGNLITVDGATGTFDALGRRAELGSTINYEQMLYAAFAPNHTIGLAAGLTAAGIRLPTPGGGEAVFGSAGLAQYRNPNWQRSQVLLSSTTQTTPTFGGAFTPFGEKYATYAGGYNGYFAGMLGVADEGSISDAYQAEARLYHQAEGRWVSPDPAGMGAVDLANPQTLNRYAYVGNDPLNNVDPSGTCELPLVYVPNANGDGGTCQSANSPSTLNVSYGNCAMATALSGGAPVSGCPGSTSYWQQLGVGGQSGALSTGRVPYKITCGTVLPDGRTVGSYVSQVSNTINNSVANGSTPSGPSASFASGYSPLSVPGQVYSQVNFKVNLRGQGNPGFLGDAGNFAYAAVSANIGIPLLVVEAVAGGYALWAGHADANGPFFMDASATAQVPAGYGAGCKGD